MIGFWFTWLMTAFGLIYGGINPLAGLMVYYAFTILRPTSLWFWAFDQFSPPRFMFYVAVPTLIGWILRGCGDWTGIKPLTIPLLGMGLYLFSGALAWQINDISQIRPWEFYYPQLTVGIMMILAITLVRDARQIRILAWVATASLGYLAWNFNTQYLDDPLRLWRNGFGGVDNNGVALIMVMGVPLGFFMGLYDRRLWVKGLCFAAVAALAHVILFSYSRGGQLGLCIVGVTLFFITLIGLPRKGLTIALGLVFTAVILQLAGPLVRERFMTIFLDRAELDASAASRYSTWAGAWQCMRDYPLGVGPRNFNLISHLYGLPRNKSVHNLFLQIGADYGFAGMFGLAVFYFGTIWKTFQMTRTSVAKRLVWPRYFGHMVVVSLSGFLTCSLFVGVEAVEASYIVSIIGLCTVAHVHRLRAIDQPGHVLELQEVPRPTREQSIPEFA